MNKKQSPKKRRGATVAAVLCFVAAIAIAGTYTLRGHDRTQQEEKLAQAGKDGDNTKDKAEESEEASGEAKKAESLVISESADVSEEAGASGKDSDAEDIEEAETSGVADSNSAASAGTVAGAAAAGQSGAAAQDVSAQNTAIHFEEGGQLLWPVDGAVLLSYSMDKTVYFPTLDQYKYNPAMIISGAENDQVICGAPGIVKSIDVTAQTGTTVNIDLGNGYELLYGQLKEVPVKVGDYVEAKTVLGYVSQPTKYYSVEGANVYFEMRKDGQPVNPADYL